MDTKQIQEIIDRANEMAQEYLDGIAESFSDATFGTTNPNNEQIRAFFEMQLQRYPPALYTRLDPETGAEEVRFDSPWMIALREKNCRGGEAVARRIERALSNGAS